MIVFLIKPLHLNISMYFLHTVRRILRCWHGEFVQQSRASLVGDHFLYSHYLKCLIQGWYCKEKLDKTFKSCFSSRTVFAGEYHKLKDNYLPHLIRKKIWSWKFSQRNLHCGLWIFQSQMHEYSLNCTQPSLSAVADRKKGTQCLQVPIDSEPNRN